MNRGWLRVIRQSQGTSSPSSQPEPASDHGLEELPSPVQRPQLEMRASRRGFEIIGLLSTFCVCIVTAGIATLILGWVHVFHDPEFVGGGLIKALHNGTFAVREPSGSGGFISTQTHSETLRILMFSALASHLVSVTGTILVTLLAYRTATRWLRVSENPEDINLTPVQHGLLVRTLGSGSLMSIINTLRYIARTRRAIAPGFFKEAISGVTGIYILSHVVGLADLWLHSSARSISVARTVPIGSNAAYGFAYNEHVCGPFDKTALPCQNLIGLSQGVMWWAPEKPWIYVQSYDTVSDGNPYKRVEYTNDTAFFTPGPATNFKSQGFTFNTHGLRVQCSNLRDRCNRMPNPLLEAIVPGTAPVTNCSAAGYPNFPYYTSGYLKSSGIDTRNIQNLVIGIIGDEMGGMIHGTPDFSSAWTPNPALALVQMRWPNETVIRDSGTPAVMYANALDLYVECRMTFLDLLAQYDPIAVEWSILETNLSAPELASALWTPAIFQMATDDVFHALRPYILNSGPLVIGALEKAMARFTLGHAAPLTKPTVAQNVSAVETVILGLYPTAPTLFLVGCLYLYSFVAFIIFLLSCTSNTRIIFVPRHLTREGKKDEKRSALDVAQTWLTDPLPLMGSIFPGGDGRHIMRSVESDPLLQVYDRDWELGRVGIGLYKGTGGEMIFGLMQQHPRRSRRYGKVFPVVDGESVLQDRFPVPGAAVIMPSLSVMGRVHD